MLTNRDIKKAQLYRLKDELIKKTKAFKVYENMVIADLKEEIRYIRKGKERKKNYSFSLNRFINAYSELLDLQESIDRLENWDAKELECY